MAYVRIVNEDEAQGSVAEDYQYLSDSYSKMIGHPVPAPQVYRPHSLVPEYFRFGALQNRVLTHDGQHDLGDGLLPPILVNFAVALHSSCYY